MYSSLVKSVKNLLKTVDALPQKKLGQNFLIDKSAMERILAAADIRQDDLVLEIGAGIGNLTQELAKKAKKVIAVEKDPKMCEILRKLLEIKKIKNVEVVAGDIRQIENCKLKIENYKVVANIPYYLTAFLIRNLLENKTPPKDMTLVVQKEVAQRICARPPRPKGARLAPQRGAAKMNLLAVSVQFYAEPKIISYIKKGSFWPVPKVDSAILKIAVNRKQKTKNRDFFFKIVRAAFSQPRKQLLNNLSNGLKLDKEEVKSWLLKNNIQSTQRAETLAIEDWVRLTTNKNKEVA